jgi:hypothetical protein
MRKMKSSKLSYILSARHKNNLNDLDHSRCFFQNETGRPENDTASKKQ